MRKALVATIGLALMTLAGCGDLQDSRTLLRDVVMGGGDRAQPTPMPRVTQAMLAQQKTPLISAHVERTEGNALLALAGRNAGVDTYVSGDGSTLAFRDGVLVATRGLAGADLMSAEVPSAPSFPQAPASTSAACSTSTGIILSLIHISEPTRPY